MFVTSAESMMVDVAGLMESVMLWLIAFSAFLAIIFAILILRQVGRMIKILPTPISPIVKTMTVGYLIFTVVVLGLVVNYLV